MKMKTQKKQEKIRDDLIDFAADLRASGKTDREISQIIGEHLKREKKKTDMPRYTDLVNLDLKKILESLEAKPESILIEILDHKKISFDLNYRIGSFNYFLIEELVIIFLDQNKSEHQIRDRSLNELGYEVLYVSTSDLIHNPDAFIKELKLKIQ